MLDLHTLRVFKAVLQTGSVSAAADVMNTVQSNVTQRLKKLESNIGCKLFERSKKGMVPTRMGHLLSQHADRILAAVQLAEQSLAVALQRQQQIRIVSMQTTAAVRLPNVLVRYYKTFPKMHLQMVTCDSQTAFQKILDGQADVGFVSGYERHPSLCQIPVFHE
jgi:DNA-binding transcriptional LysR family regulator